MLENNNPSLFLSYLENEDVQKLQETPTAVELLIRIQLGPGLFQLAAIVLQQVYDVHDVTLIREVTVLAVDDQLDEHEAHELLEPREMSGQEGGEVEHVVRMVQSDSPEVFRELS